LDIFLFTTASRPSLGPNQSPAQGVSGLYLGVRRPGHEAYHSFPSSAEVKNACSYTSTPQYVFVMWHFIKQECVVVWCFVKHRDDMPVAYQAIYLLDFGSTFLWWTIGWSGFESQRGLEIFLFDTMTRPALGPKQPPIQWVPGALSLGVKRPER